MKKLNKGITINLEMVEFVLAPSEIKKAEKWKKNHSKKCTVDFPGNKFSYIFFQTDIGTICTVECICENSMDITDYKLW